MSSRNHDTPLDLNGVVSPRNDKTIFDLQQPFLCLYFMSYTLTTACHLLCISNLIQLIYFVQKILSANNASCIYFCLFVWFDSLRPINNLSVIKGRVFLGWTSTKLGLMFLLKDTTQWRRWGSNPRPFGLESSTLPLSHCAPTCIYSNALQINFINKANTMNPDQTPKGALM